MKSDYENIGYTMITYTYFVTDNPKICMGLFINTAWIRYLLNICPGCILHNNFYMTIVFYIEVKDMPPSA